MKKTIFKWLIVSFVITVLSCLILLVGQQSLRQSANDPQIQFAEEVADSLSQGADPQMLGQPSVDIAKSLAPYVVIYDKDGKPVASTAMFNGQAPQIPSGIFDYIKKKNSRDIVTWQPSKDVRQAIVVMPYSHGDTSGFVMAGKSLREVEKREKALTIEVGTVWVFLVVSSLFFLWLYQTFKHKKTVS